MRLDRAVTKIFTHSGMPAGGAGQGIGMGTGQICMRPLLHAPDTRARIGVMLRPLCLLFLLTLVVVAKDPTDWKAGKLLNLTNASQSKVVGVNGIVNTKIRHVFTFVVDGGEKVYEATEIGTKAPHVEVNAPITFSVSKDNLFVKDTDGKVHKLALIKTTRKE